MQFSERRNTTRWIIIITSFVIVSLILWNTYTFFQIFKHEERTKMELWAKAQKNITTANLDTEIELPSFILENNKNIPLILTDSKGKIISTLNIDEIEKDSVKLKRFLDEIKNQNKPIKVQYDSNSYNIVYYGNSSLLNKLKYYPVALLLIIFLFGAVVYNFYKSTKMATQNKLWAGMAKETAHQIGTPLSSLIGWLEIMKADNVDETTVSEIEKDINRLQTITERFSKIGSEPVLETLDIVEETLNSFDYLKSRFSNQVEFEFTAPKTPILVSINPALHSWTIENLMKNAIDAMKGRGKLKLAIENETNSIKINVSDSGKGIPKNQYKRVFEPGFTTKRRGWGLGLSLTKRIVEEYHNGKIKVAQSEIGKGTTMQIIYKKVK
ncbi:sensor histidine kinase [Flavobacterium aquatile]|uniref:histidine kinase n=1 Tax=Flavobacterium aquatile LMG 4008 = ATCC 11947 TaxID=1453498 RepID=A0A095SWU4_9FLAO|nr:HAMP domain-containing sensor histidine kinase [Flavobacterium aquatile]KGD69136.1 histidine kinase [Flavobacterium aquatile LMG 4008 = ATCC 11947]OXA65845.1 two-component sensor histidine kinase [Flavobacterium aquatile LMG 4008 = ATCC 11947]GEC78008.1 two-component sensor histidine kinase [Flavobacterium aquatile]